MLALSVPACSPRRVCSPGLPACSLRSPRRWLSRRSEDESAASPEDRDCCRESWLPLSPEDELGRDGDGRLGEGRLGDGKLGEGKLGEGRLGEGRLGDGKLGEGRLGEGGLGDGRLGEGVPLPEEGMRGIGIGGEGIRGVGNWTAQPQLSTLPINRAAVSLPGVGRFGCALRFIGLPRGW